MPDTRLNSDPSDDTAYDHPPDEDTGKYHAMRGKRTNRVTQLRFIPRQGQYDRFLPFADLRLMDVRKDGSEIALEFSATLVVISGQRLKSVGSAIAAMWCACVEAFDPDRRDMPDDPAAPFIENISFFVPKAREESGRRPGKRPSATAQPESS